MESYVERPPLPELAGVVRTVWIQRTGDLSRECLRLTGVTPRELLGGDLDRCACGHDHSASYRPFLATRDRRVLFKTAPPGRASRRAP